MALVHGRGAGRRRVGARGARHADHHRVHKLQVARVGRHRDHDLGRRVFLAHARSGAGVVFHVAGPAQVLAKRLVALRFLELRENLRVGLPHHVGQHVEAAAMRHADQHVAHAGIGRVGDDLVEDRDHHVQALDGEPRLAGEGLVQELLEGLDLGDALEQVHVFHGRRGRAERAGLHVMTQPLALFRHEDVREVEADARAVDAPQPLDGLGGIGGAFGQRPSDQARRQLPQLGVGDAVRLGVQRRVAHRRRAERVDGRGEVAVAADGLRQIHGADDGG